MTLLYKIAEKVYELENKGTKVIKMNVGELDFDTPEEITKIALQKINEGQTRYGSAAGEKALREEIASIHGAEIENVAIAPGAKWGIYSMIDLICRNKKALTFSPGWPAYESMLRHFNGELHTLPLMMENEWHVEMDKYEKATKGKSMVIINNPSNPTSQVWDDEIQKKLAEIAMANGAIPLLDLAYRDIAFDKKPDWEWKKGTVVCNSFSKSLAMTGWRVGYVVADREIIERYVKLYQISLTCVPKFIQLAALGGLKKREQITSRFREECKKRAAAAMEVLRKNNIECTEPQAGFYVFPKLPCRDAVPICMKLLNEKRIAIVPGSVFGNYPQNVRISLCYSPKIIRNSMAELMDVLK